jgi:hypothetical protein
VAAEHIYPTLPSAIAGFESRHEHKHEHK